MWNVVRNAGPAKCISRRQAAVPAILEACLGAPLGRPEAQIAFGPGLPPTHVSPPTVMRDRRCVSPIDVLRLLE